MLLWFYVTKFSIVIDYNFVLIHYMLLFMFIFGFEFCFNRLLYIVIDYKGLKGFFCQI